MAETKVTDFSTGEYVYAFQNNGSTVLYEAKILNIKEMQSGSSQEMQKKYLIHYKGWNHRYDEWVPDTALVKKTPEAKTLFDSTQKGDDSKTKNKEKKNQNTNKRKRREDDDYDMLPVKIILNNPLRKLLINDWGLVTQNKDLVPIPRSPSVDSIIKDFKRQCNDMDEGLFEYVDFLQIIFDEVLGVALLYRLERPQYKRLLVEFPNTRSSSLYGAEHLLRLFIKLPSLLVQSGIEEEAVEKTKIVCSKLLEYMDKNQAKLFLGEYEIASEEILKEAGLYIG